MSKKNKNNTKSKLIPKLRFPEFKDKPQWEVKTIGEVTTNESSALIQGALNFVDEGYPVYGADGIVGNIDFYQQEEPYISIVKDGAVGRIGLHPAKSSVAGTLTYIKPANKELYNLEFLYYLFHKIDFSYYKVGTTIPHIYYSEYRYKTLPFPSLAEQERIGALFSTLDSLIQAQSKEVQLLRLRKKGLMQKMFPYEGETTPEWRFPEFKDAPEWEEVSFINCIKLYRGSSPRPIKNYITKDKDGVNWIKIGDATNCENKIINNVSEKITREGALRSRKVTKGELILANSMSYGKVYELGIDGYIYDGWFVLREYEEHYNRDFLRFMLNSDFIQKQYRQTSAGGVVLNISSDIVYNTQLYLTSKAEQKRIASMFSTLDALIEAKSQRLEQLKNHKKGLMQQLFP